MELDPHQERELKDLYSKYSDKKLPIELPQIILDVLGIDISASYVDLKLRNPIMVAPGQMTLSEGQIKRIADAGYGGLVLKSVVGEDKNSNASMAEYGFRRKPTYIKTVFDETDTEKKMPIIHWDGRLDTRGLDEYLEFAEKALNIGKERNIPVIASFLSHLPQEKEDWKEEEWTYTAERFRDLGFTHVEIDFCPFLKGEDIAKNRETVLRWYREAPKLIKSKGLEVITKILNLDLGERFQIEMVEASIEGGANAVVIANRMYKPEYGSAHGGIELKKRNMKQIKNVRENGLNIPVIATGGTYTGTDATDYLRVGAQSVQLLSFIMGKPYKPPKTRKNRFEWVSYQLILNPENGLVANMLHLKNIEDISSVRELYKR